VGNHTIYGLFDAPLLFAKVYKETGLAVRSLGDKAHFQVPGWRDFLARLGTVNATRENTIALMRAGDPILVFPGGGREVMKRKGEAYRLIWKQRTGFVRLAVEYGYDIQPFASVGAEEVYDIVADANDFAASNLGRRLVMGGGRLVRCVNTSPSPSELHASNYVCFNRRPPGRRRAGPRRRNAPLGTLSRL
jgi:1-acyl-sn-glycerol-3-phosphate acyltransferase